MSNIAISYARFSSSRQADGDSLPRQIENAEKYAHANGLIIDRSMSFTDLGVSAFDGSNVERGALGLFLRAVQDGKIPVGTTLIVESFDRLSRATPFDAFGIFSQIISAGLNLVTLTTPPRLFNRASVHENMFQLFEALMDMHRANAESERKSELIGSAWRAKKIKAQTGEIMSGKSPHWIKTSVDQNLHRNAPNKRSAALISDRAKIVLRIIEMAEKGVGNISIVQTLNSEKVPAFSKTGSWQTSYIQKMLTSHALYGAIELDEKIFDNYYPPLITKERFALLAFLRSSRATTKSTNRKGQTVTNLFSGLLKCGYCKGPMNVGGYKKSATGYERKYVGCHNARTATEKCLWSGWFLDELEPSLLFWLTQVDFHNIVQVTGRNEVDTHRELLASHENQSRILEVNIENGYKAIFEGLEGMVPRVKKLQAELSDIKKNIELQRQKVESMKLSSEGSVMRIRHLVQIFSLLKTVTDVVQRRILREQISAAIHQVVEKIELFPTGHNPKKKTAGPKFTDADPVRFIDVQFKNGAQRRIEPGEC
ncbi:MAG: recombinase family protein [Janthinobacterium lividum]